MNANDCEIKANEIREKYNPDNLAPFPYKNITDDRKDLDILIAAFEDSTWSSMSGATVFDQDTQKFSIVINSNKPQTRQNFTIAHELGHYFLHSEILREEKIIVDDDTFIENKRVLYRMDEARRNEVETQANNFAAALLMPRELVVDAWKRIDDLQECAKIFGVSTTAMTIRLERLGLIE